jgi:hypothetical protein
MKHACSRERTAQNVLPVVRHSEVFASYGGLLMSLKVRRTSLPCATPCKRLTVPSLDLSICAQGDPRNLQKIELDKRIYILMRKTS